MVPHENTKQYLYTEFQMGLTLRDILLIAKFLFLLIKTKGGFLKQILCMLNKKIVLLFNKVYKLHRSLAGSVLTYQTQGHTVQGSHRQESEI